MRTRPTTVRTIIGAGLLACSNAAGPEADDLRLTVQVSAATLTGGQTATLRLRLENLRDETRVLHFGSGCQLLMFIETGDGDVVYPGGVGYVCNSVTTRLELAPLGEHSLVETIIARQPEQPDQVGIVLPKGRYRVYGLLHENNDDGYRLESAHVEFSIR